jgi:nicotinamide-nucleotide amidase
MRVHILAVGSELLTPGRLDTNSQYLSERLSDLGLEVEFKGVVGDELDPLSRAVGRSLPEADLLFLCGGLGPTGDDRTREAVSAVLGRPLILQDDLLRSLEERFRRRGKPMPEANRKQAFVLAGAETIPNPQGTAPGQWIALDKKTVILLPGPPFELQAVAEEFVWPRLALSFERRLTRAVLKTTGLTESEVESRISDLYPDGPGLRLTVLSSPGQVEIHLAGVEPAGAAESRSSLEPTLGEIRRRLGGHVFSDDGAELEEVVGRLLRSAGRTVAAAESCTGGLLGHRLTAVPGSSAYFLEGFVAYANGAKVARLAVQEEILRRHGAVSPETAAAMAEGARRVSGADFGLSTTGIAGPGGGTPEKPVGLVYVALAGEGGTRTSAGRYPGPRDRVKLQATQKALDLLRRRLLGWEDP